MNQQQDGSVGGSRARGDAEAWRTLIFGVLERFDVLAAGLLGEDLPGAGGAARAPGGARSSDFVGQARTALDGILEEVGEFVWQLLGQLIAILEAIQAALEQMIGAGAAGPSARSTGETGRDAAYQPITVEFELFDDPPGGP